MKQTVLLGQPFMLSYQENNVTVTWRVALDSITCGGGGIFSPKVLAANAESLGETPTTPTPDAGMKFCLVKFAVANLSDSNQPWSANDATVNIGMDAYADTPNDPTYSVEQAYAQEAQPADQTADDGLQPGASGVSWAVFQVPASAKVTSVSVPVGTSLHEITANVQQVLVTLGGS